MKDILTISSSEARTFFLQPSSYFYADIPQYFNFSTILNEVEKVLRGKTLSSFIDNNKKPSTLENVNYKFFTNKDGRYAWRPFQLIHPALYVNLVDVITESNNWKHITSKLIQYTFLNGHITAAGLPVVSDKLRSGKSEQINQWINEVEKNSIAHALDYRYLYCTDIIDCYGSLYTHAIPWALHGKDYAKQNKGDRNLVGNMIDSAIQSMSCGQTNGIPQGSILMDFIAEIVLCYIDDLLISRMKRVSDSKDYEIIRYRDDYRIFTNNPLLAESIIKELSELLIDIGLRINTAKTYGERNIIHSSIKQDKRYWLQYGKYSQNLQNQLITISLFAEKYPNSGTLLKLLTEFFEELNGIEEGNQLGRVDVLISIITEIALNNPKTYPIASAIISVILTHVEDDYKEIILKRIFLKFEQLPNTAIMQLWLQRITLKINGDFTFTEPICNKIIDKDQEIWNSSWLKGSLKETINNTDIVDRDELQTINKVVLKDEVEVFQMDDYPVPF